MSRSRASLLALAVVVGGLLAGCGLSDDDEPTSQSSASTTPEPSPTESATPTASVSPTPTATTTTTVTAAPSPTLAPEAALLGAAQMPAVNESSPWKLRDTGPVSSRPFGLCAKVDVLSIGAEQAVERRFTRGRDGAAQEIATFPDELTTARVQKVLRAWHRTCASRVPGTSVNVRPIDSVPVPHGVGSWYLVSYVRGGQGHFHSFGIVTVGTRTSLLRMDVTGQDHNYPPGEDPMQLAVKAAAEKLG